MTHTPGPWRVVRQNPSPTSGEWMISGAKPGYLAEIRDCGSGAVRDNANLIAAAPDLLDALRALSNLPEFDGSQAVSEVRRNIKRQVAAAITKATGEKP